MSVKRSLSASPSPSPSPTQMNCDEVPRQPENSTKEGFCQVCGDKASIINYGALSCHSCKTFFRRNGFDPQSVRPCLFNNSCEVNMTTRRSCTACRLAKCLSVGMSSDLIRKEEPKNKKYQSSSQPKTTDHAVSKQVISAPQQLILNRLHKNPPLNNSEWILLSNIVDAHDTFTTMPQIFHILEGLHVPSLNMQIDETLASEIIALLYTSMQSFISSSPDFQVLTTNEQFSLFERNLSAITVFYFVLTFSDAFSNNESKCIDLFTTIYGPEILFQAKHINKQLVDDLTIVKLMLLVLAFSSNCFAVDIHENMFNDSFLHGTHRLLGSQNIYIELLWKFMISHHDYYNSVRRFSRLMELFLNLIKYFTIAYKNNPIYHQLVDNIFKKAKQSVMTNQNKQVQLWGRT